MPAAHILPNLFDDPLLGTGQFVWQCVETVVECGADLVYGQADGVAGLDVFLLQERQLQEEELLELQAAYRFLEGVAVGGEVYVAYGVGQRHQGVFLEYVVREGFLDFGQAHCQRGGLKLAHHLAGDSAVLKFFSAGIYSRERAFAVGTADHGTIHFGMHHVQAAVEFRGLAEE